ncbi:MAG: bacterial Ig-like domain-containing protein [Clostridia bacterium]|nr:bacterial Ig-like domain-containing protein [Clostridia bacterium]
MRKNFAKKFVISALVGAFSLCTALGIALSGTAKAAEETDYSSVDGISVVATGTEGDKNMSLYVNLPEVTALTDVKSIIFDITLEADDYCTPLMIDTNGNYYEIASANGATGSYKVGRSLSLLSEASSVTAGAWFGLLPEAGRGLDGRAYYSFAVEDWLMRANLDNYGNPNKNLELAALQGSALTKAQSLKAVGFRTTELTHKDTNLVFGDVYLEKTDGTISRIVNSSEVEMSEDLKHNYTGNYAWVGYVGNFGVFDADKKCTQCGWLNNVTENGWDIATSDGGVDGYFEGMNYRQTSLPESMQYQKFATPAYADGFENSAIILEYYDRGGEACKFEPKIVNGTTYATLNGVTAYFVDMSGNLVDSERLSWAITPPAGFVGYIVLDTAGCTNAEYLALADHANELLNFGFHGNWNGGKLFNADLGAIKVAEGGLSAQTDFFSLINGAEAYYSFASSAMPDGLNAQGLTFSEQYGLVLNKVMKSYDFKSSNEVVYGRLDGLNFQISDPTDEEYHYMYVKGYSSDLTETDYFSLRVADHAYNSGSFEFFFYDAQQTFNTRSGINQTKEVYLFNKDGSFNKSIYPDNEWSWVTLPAGFDGYMVIPSASIDWILDKSKAVYATVISQGTQGISNNQQGTTDTPLSSGFNIEFGQMKSLVGTFDAAKSNFLELLENGTVYADTLSTSRSGRSAQVSGATYMFTPVVGSLMDCSYMPVEGIVLDAKESAGSATLESAIVANADRLAFYIYNESMESMEIALSYSDGTYPETATLISVVDDVYNQSLTDGKISIPDGFEGYLIVDYKGGKPVFTLDEGERLGITDIFSLAAGVTVENGNEVFTKSLAVLRTVSSTDEQIAAVFTANGLSIKRAVNSYYSTPDAPSNFEQEASLAKVGLLDDDNYIFAVRDSYPVFKSPEMYEDTPTVELALAPQLVKNNAKYVLADEGETVNLEVLEAGMVYVFAPKTFECEGFTKTMAMESFFEGIDGRVFCFKKACETGERLALSGAYFIVIDGEVSPFIALTVPAKQMFFEDIPDEYLLENFIFQGIPTIAMTSGGRMFVSAMTGGKTEPVVENVVITYASDDNGKTFSPYMLCDHPYETMARIYDPMFWYDNGRLWYFFTQADKGQSQMATYMCYTDNPDAQNLADIEWTEPVYLIKGVLSEKPNRLQNGKIVYSTSLYNDVCDGKVHVFESTDGGMTASLIGVADPNPSASFVFPEPKIVEMKNGTLWLLKRVDGNNENRVEQSFSIDGGKTWTVGQFNDDLLCGSSRFVFDRLPSGNLIYIGNFGTQRNRSHIKVLLSEDDGKTWPYSIELDHRTWISYPDYTITPDGKIMVLYDRGRTTQMELRTAIIDEADIKAGRIVSEGSSLMNILFKNPKYMEIEKVFALPEATYDQELNKNVVVFPEGTTRAQVVKAFPSEGVSVGLNTGELKQVLGGWTLGSINADGYGTITFVPTGGLPWNIEDTYRLLEITVKIEKAVAEATVTGIEITSEPTKKTYTLGEALDLEGLVVVEKYSDGTSKLLERSEYAVSDLDSMTAGEKTITVSKDGFSATFKVTVQSGGTGGSTGSGENGGNGGSQGGEQGGKGKKGCGSSVSGAALAMLTLLGVGVVLKKKR